MNRLKRFMQWLWSVSLILIGIYFLFFSNREAFQRQEIEQSLADSYLEELYGEKDSSAELEKNEEEWEDNVWYVRDGIHYTPDYAKGFLECVLEIPSVKIRRGVYSGTWEEIQHNLDIWMVTAARPDYELGKTHYCIYGHNHTVQNLSFNRLKDVKKGELFKLTCEKGIFTYKVSEIFALWREEVTEKLVDNFNLSANECYIITCGRGENRYKDLVVKGILQSKKEI
ncbi:MAG TPA: sortase [Candidatus Fimimorpha faecalis]|uniref:Sortase n=1 Tax=Candidatus Fimimorpha faecalis TaxID=2840824 RepID=A0A9D1JD11_9FIRM|nr:sortase [Candidatus Fimimorpha faecalis]